MLVIPLLWVLNWVVSGKPLPNTPLNPALLLLMIMVLVSLWATYDVAISLPKISGIILGVGVYFAVVLGVDQRFGFWIAALFFVGLGLGVAALGVLGINWSALAKIYPLTGLVNNLTMRLAGLPGAETGINPNQVAGALTWVLPLLLTLGGFFVWRFRFVLKTIGKFWATLTACLLIISSFIVLAIFLLSQSRSAYLGLAFILPVMVSIILPKKHRKLSWFVFIGLTLILVLGVFLVTAWDVVHVWVSDGQITTNINSFIYHRFRSFRLQIWSRAIYSIRDVPFTGMGLNTFRQVVNVVYPFPLGPSDGDIAHAHNEFLQVALDLGIPGLIAFLAVNISAYWMLISAWQHAATTPIRFDTRDVVTSNQILDVSNPTLLTRAIVLGLGGGLTAHLVYGFIDAIAIGAKPGVIFWFLLGLISGVYRKVRLSSVIRGNSL